MLFVLAFALISLVCSKVDVQGLDAPWGTFIPGEYVVIYHENTTLEAATSHWGFVKKMGVEMIHTYTIGTTFKGFNAKISKDMLQTLQEDPMISEIHANAIAHTTQQKCHVRQDDAPSWGLTRVSHAGAVDGGMNNHYSHHEKGSGVNVYVLDTGVFVDHPDIRGRAFGEPILLLVAEITIEMVTVLTALVLSLVLFSVLRNKPASLLLKFWVTLVLEAMVVLLQVLNGLSNTSRIIKEEVKKVLFQCLWVVVLMVVCNLLLPLLKPVVYPSSSLLVTVTLMLVGSTLLHSKNVLL
jgi:hypothetical protein